MSDVYNRENPPPPPDRVGPYRIEERLGVGGMGEVFRAFDERLERWVAIKQILPGEGADVRARERLRREARAVASLNHPSIVQIHDIIETSDGDWIVMEFVEGHTLQQLASAGSLEIGQILRLGREIAEGLAEAHGKGVVHRDLKTENVMVTRDGHAKILDFGLAKRLWHHRKNEVSLSVQGSILGTGRAMSPEQVLGDDVTHRSDLFSLGTLLYETVTGQRPFAGMSLIMTLAQVCTEVQVPPIELNPNLPEDLSHLIERLLEKEAENRPDSAIDVARELDRIAASLARHDVALPSSAPDPVSSSGSSLSNTRQIMRIPASPSRSESSTGIFIKTLLQVTVLGVRALNDEIGSSRGFEVMTQHDRMARDLLVEHDGLEINRSEGFLLLFERPVDAVRYSLSYHRKLAELSAKLEIDLEARAGIHLGEVFLRENTPEDVHRGAKPLEVEGLARLVAARVAGLAEGGQTLLTQEAYDLARRAMGERQFDGPEEHWVEHGLYRFQGVEESVRIFELLPEEGNQPSPPPDNDKAHRVAEPGTSLGQKPMWLALGALAAVLLLVIFRLQPPASSDGIKTPNLPPGEVRPAVAVLGFKNLSGRASADWLSTALAELFTSELALGEDIRMVAGERVARLKQEIRMDFDTTLAADTLRTIRVNLGTDYVILGSYLSLEQEGENRLRLQLRLQDTRRGETIASVQETGAEGELFELVFRASKVVRQKLEVDEVSTSQAGEVMATMPQGRDAMRHYSEGLEKLRNFDARAARDDLEKTVELDPEFALGHAALSQAWLELGYVKRAEEIANRALEIAQNLGLPRETLLLIEGNAYEAAQNWEEAIRIYRILSDFFPDNVDYGLRLAQAQIEGKIPDQAFETVAALQSLPGPAGEHLRIDLVEGAAAFVTGDFERVLEVAERVAREGADQGGILLVGEAKRLQGFALVFLGQKEKALGFLQEALELFVAADHTRLVGDIYTSLAYTQYLLGNLESAEISFRESLRRYEELGVEDRISGAKDYLAMVEFHLGEMSSAQEILEEALATARELGNRQREVRYLLTSARVLMMQGRLDDARQAAQTIEEIATMTNDTERLAYANLYLGQIELLAGDVVRSRFLHGRAVEKGREIGAELLRQLFLEMALPSQGGALMAAGQVDEARGVFEEFWQMRRTLGSGPLPDVSVQVHLHVALGEPMMGYSLAERAIQLQDGAGAPDFAALSRAAYADVLLEADQAERAREVFGGAAEHLAMTESDLVRLVLRTTAAQLAAAEGGGDAARRELATVIEQARRKGLVAIELDARLALGEIELAMGRPGSEQRLEELEQQAESAGFKYLAGVARRLTSDSPALP